MWRGFKTLWTIILGINPLHILASWPQYFQNPNHRSENTYCLYMLLPLTTSQFFFYHMHFCGLYCISACPPQLVSTPLSSVQCSCCVYWPVQWLATSWTGKWRSVRRKMQMHKQRKGMRKVQWLLFRLRHCFASYRLLYTSQIDMCLL